MRFKISTGFPLVDAYEFLFASHNIKLICKFVGLNISKA